MHGTKVGWWSRRRRRSAWLLGATALGAVALVALGATPSGYMPPSGGGYTYTYTSSLKVEAEGTGSGSVTAGLAGMDGDGLMCTSTGGDESGDCADSYQWTTSPPSVLLVAVAQPGSTFVGWEGDGAVCGSSQTCTVVVPSNSEVKARFELAAAGGTVVLTVSTQGTGQGSVTGEGIDCHRAGGATSGDCTQGYAPGSQVALTATADTGSTFSGSWGGACAGFGTNPTCTVTMSAAQAASAHFTLSAAPSGACTITGTNGADILNGTRGNDIICGRAGNDTIDGKGGNDVVRAGTGADVVKGGRGNDMLFGERGADVLKGGTGTDTANGGPGIDVCTAEATSGCP